VARRWEDFEIIVESLLNLEEDETLLIQSERAVGIFKIYKNTHRLILANALIV